jgi:sugar phosphate isomerase/epimerase
MQLGIFSTVFDRGTLEEKVDAVRDAGFACVQFHMQCAGVEPMPDAISENLCSQIRQAHGTRGISIGAVSGTFNMIHPDLSVREAGLARLAVLAGACEAMGAPIITLCTGTRNTEWMWRPHPDNSTPEAWRDLVVSMARAAEIAEANRVLMAFEPEVANTVDSAKKARKLIDEVGSSHIKVVMDGANIYHPGELAHMHAMLEEAFDLLGEDIVHAHAKDLDHDGEAGKLAAGTGLLDYEYYINLLERIGFTGPMVLHGLDESQVPTSRDFVIGKMNHENLFEE